MNSTDSLIQTLAAEAASWFETARRATGDTETGPRDDGERFVRTKDGAPEWVGGLVYAAHGGDFLPDDHRYAMIRSALDWIAENGYDEDDGAQHEFADAEVSVYTGERYAWLASNLNRQGYINQAVSDLGVEPTANVAEMIGWGWYMEAREVFESVAGSLEAEAEKREEV